MDRKCIAPVIKKPSGLQSVFTAIQTSCPAWGLSYLPGAVANCGVAVEALRVEDNEDGSTGSEVVAPDTDLVGGLCGESALDLVHAGHFGFHLLLSAHHLVAALVHLR